MNIRKVIVHQLGKNRAEKSELSLREKELTVTEPAENLIRAIRHAYDERVRPPKSSFLNGPA